MPQIHPSAVVERGARIADDAIIGPFCHVGPQAAIGPGTRLVGHVTVLGHTTIGCGNTIWPQAVLGGDPQDLKFQGEETILIIGDHNQIRESVTAHLGTRNGGGRTQIGDDNLIMAYSHVGHDCVLENHIVLANGVQLAGHIHVQEHANIGGATALHHYVTVGQYSFVGGMSRIVHDVPPFMLVEGTPARVRKVNTVGLARHRFPPDQVERLKQAQRILYRGGGSPLDRSMAENLKRVEREYPDDECVQILVQFIQNMHCGLFGRYRESLRRDDRYQSPAR